MSTFSNPSTINPSVRIPDDRTDWLETVSERIESLSALPENWDSYEARRVDGECAKRTLSLLSDIFRPGLPVPAIVPTNSGGLQIEWHTQGMDVELVIAPGNRMELFFENLETGEEWEGPILSDRSPLNTPLEKLSGNA